MGSNYQSKRDPNQVFVGATLIIPYSKAVEIFGDKYWNDIEQIYCVPRRGLDKEWFNKVEELNKTAQIAWDYVVAEYGDKHW